MLRTLHVSRLYVRYGHELRPLTVEQARLVAACQLDQPYDRAVLCDATRRPYFVEEGVRRDVFFDTGLEAHVKATPARQPSS